MPSYKSVITVGDVNDKRALGFTVIEVWASDNEGGSYEEMTAATPQPARYYSAPTPPNLTVGGYTFKFSFDGGDPISVTFSDLFSVWSVEMVAARLNEAMPGRASIQTIGRSTYVVLSSSGTGRASSVACVYSENPQVFPVAMRAGQDGRIPLVADKYIYEYLDPSGKATTRYRWRFSAGGTSPFSEFSFRRNGRLDRAPQVPVSVATARFVGLDGQPVSKKIIISEDLTQPVLGQFVVGTQGELSVIESDESGFWQAVLPQGLRVKVAIEGTAYLREIVVPAVPTFDLLAAMVEATDMFSVQQVPPLLTRRSL